VRDVDAIVVGGGPAGAAAALVLARGGARTVVFERAPMPRDKVCGDLLGTDAIATLRQLGVAQSVLAGSLALTGAVLHGPRGARYGARAATSRADTPSDARVIPRERFDAALLAASVAAGARVRYERVLAVERDSSIACVRTAYATLRAPIVIGADGWGSHLARALGNPPPGRANIAIAARTYARGVRGLDRRMHFFVNATGDGYGWIFPLGNDAANVGLGFLRSEGASDLRAAFERFRASRSPANAFLREASFTALAAWPIPVGPRTMRVAAEGMYLAGDAAGLASPLSGSGIHHALASGAVAGRHALRALAGDRGAAYAYQRFIAARMVTRLRVEAFAHRTFSTAATVERYAPWTRVPGGGALLSRALLALG